jgi:ADP-ribose pyrophosphatase YjhB (NUDIX family)
MEYWQTLRQLTGQETLIIPSAAGAIMRDGQVLLVRHGLLKKWQLPGGMHEVGESIQETAEREIREELGLNLKAESLVGVYSGARWLIEYPDGSKIQQLMCFFMMVGDLSPIRIQESEITAYEFFELDQIPADTMECCKQKICDLKAYTGKVILR